MQPNPLGDAPPKGFCVPVHIPLHQRILSFPPPLVNRGSSWLQVQELHAADAENLGGKHLNTRLVKRQVFLEADSTGDSCAEKQGKAA